MPLFSAIDRHADHAAVRRQAFTKPPGRQLYVVMALTGLLLLAGGPRSALGHPCCTIGVDAHGADASYCHTPVDVWVSFTYCQYNDGGHVCPTKTVTLTVEPPPGCGLSPESASMTLNDTNPDQITTSDRLSLSYTPDSLRHLHRNFC